MKKIIHVVDIAVPPKDVFEALTTEKGLSNWWTTTVEITHHDGDTINFTFAGEFNPSMAVTHHQPNRRVHWRCVAGHANWQDNTFTFEVEPQDTGTRLRFTQNYANELDDDVYGIYNFNWGYYLESLRLYCTTGQGKPFIPPA